MYASAYINESLMVRGAGLRENSMVAAWLDNVDRPSMENIVYFVSMLWFQLGGIADL